MERKIGEIFEFGGEWYQCIIGHCNQCSFDEAGTCKFIGNPYCAYRNDKKLACFKKLEKVGEPFTIVGKLYQHYKVFDIDNVCGDGFWCVHNYKAKTLTIEIKQNKEDMGDLDKIKVRDYTKVEELNVMEEKTLNLKPFDIQKAREGKPVCTRDGRKARIICFDRKFYHDGYNYPIVAMVNDNDNELVHAYTQDGLLVGNMEGDLDLMMLPEKKDGWVNVAKEPLGDDEVVLGYIFNSYEDAVRSGKANERYVATVRIEWEG